jgi:hypothetical protein
MPKIAIQGAILDRLQDMRGLNVLSRGEIGDGARDLEDAIVGSGAQIELFHGEVQEFFAFRVQFAMCFQQTMGHLGIGAAFRTSGEAFVLELARREHALADRSDE